MPSLLYHNSHIYLHDPLQEFREAFALSFATGEKGGVLTESESSELITEQ